MRAIRSWAVLLLVVLGAAEVLGLLGLAALSKLRGLKYDPISEERLPARTRERIRELLEGRARYLIPSATLGWTLKPRGSVGPYRASAQGLRSDREYAAQPARGVLRLATFGDSFTHGDDVGNAETWQAQLERLDPRIEALNFGLMGYAPDQGLLRYEQDGARFAPQLVLMGVMPENVVRIVNVFRPFYSSKSELPFAKPRFVLETDRLRLLPNPLPSLDAYQALLRDPATILPRLGAHDYFWRTRLRPGPLDAFAPVRIARLLRQEHALAPGQRLFVDGRYNTGSEAFALMVRLLDELRRQALARGSVPAILLLPDRSDLVRARRGDAKRYQPLLEALQRDGQLWLDGLDALADPAAGPVDGIVRGHYTARGNALLAQQLRAWLTRRALFDPEARERVRRSLEASAAAGEP